MEPIHRTQSARNGFVVASILLFAFLATQYLQTGEWAFYIGTAFFLSQVAFWLS
jgi:hypothetical protein